MKLLQGNRIFFGAALAVSLAVFTSCAHKTHTRGSVAMKHSDSEADICLGDNEVELGDNLTFYENRCEQNVRSGDKGGAAKAACKKVKVGTGKVLRLLDEHYSTASVEAGTTFKVGTIVEKD